MAIFLAFPVAAVVMLTLGDRLRSGAAESPLMRFGTLASAALPLLLALYLAAVPRYGGAWELQLGFVLLMSAGLLALSLGHREEGLHLLGGFTALAVIARHFATSYRGAEYPRILGFLAAVEVDDVVAEAHAAAPRSARQACSISMRCPSTWEARSRDARSPRSSVGLDDARRDRERVARNREVDDRGFYPGGGARA